MLVGGCEGGVVVMLCSVCVILCWRMLWFGDCSLGGVCHVFMLFFVLFGCCLGMWLCLCVVFFVFVCVLFVLCLLCVCVCVCVFRVACVCVCVACVGVCVGVCVCVCVPGCVCGCVCCMCCFSYISPSARDLNSTRMLSSD